MGYWRIVLFVLCEISCGHQFWKVYCDATFLPEASFGLQVLSSPVSVCPSVPRFVCQSRACPRDKFLSIQATITKFGPEVPNNLRVDRPWPSRSNLTQKSKFIYFDLVCTITCHPFKLETSNFDQKCILVWLRSKLFGELFNQGQI